MAMLLIDKCIEDINSIEESSDVFTVLEHCHVFFNDFKDLLQNFEHNTALQQISSKQVQDCIFLCFSQLRKCLLMMISILKPGVLGKIPMESKTFICIRMCTCFRQLSAAILKALSAAKPSGSDASSELDSDEEDLSGGLFIIRMDQVLSLLAVFETAVNSGYFEQCKPLAHWRAILDDLLGHAMTIAQVSSGPDLLDIKCSCEKILREFGSLRSEYEKQDRDVCECKLYAVSLSSALMKLEQKVCSTVLKMHLSVFSEPSAPLRALVRSCWREPLLNDERRLPDDVETMVSAFDDQMDRMLQIALFAAASTTNESVIRSIRSCLASLESMEPHLVPALQALYLRKKDRLELQQLVRLLSEHWIDEVHTLRGFIDSIVDSASLARVCLEEVSTPALSLKKSLASGKTVPAEDLSATVASISLFASALGRQLSTAIKCPNVKDRSSLESAVQELHRVTQHLKDWRRLPEDSNDRSKRCMKRCEVVVSCIKRLIPVLEEAFTVDAKEEALPSLEYPDSIRDLPQDISLHLNAIANVVETVPAVQAVEERAEIPDVSVLTLNRSGRASLRSTSILYKEKATPNRRSTRSTLLRSVLMENARRSGMKRRSSLFNQTLGVGSTDSSAVSAMQETLGLTQLLDGLTSLSDTLRSGHPAVAKGDGTERGRESKLDVSDDEFASCLGVEMSLDSGGSSSICTPQRLRDLAELRDRIDALRKAHDVT